ncbi:hypothetical protein [Natronoglomus mannanivorans]|uniref:Uncharacterized protein n=1 Tax=Natronoglomus mannanivorans TaxID=2979990 RepID=A0AAP2Z362_9EURY|nr:hypothetical protein [Halobacteria archaeon AArc-xg1-1]
METEYSKTDLNQPPTSGCFERDIERVVDAIDAAMAFGRTSDEFFEEVTEHARRFLHQSEEEDVPAETAVSAAWFLILFLNEHGIRKPIETEDSDR